MAQSLAIRPTLFLMDTNKKPARSTHKPSTLWPKCPLYAQNAHYMQPPHPINNPLVINSDNFTRISPSPPTTYVNKCATLSTVCLHSQTSITIPSRGPHNLDSQSNEVLRSLWSDWTDNTQDWKSTTDFCAYLGNTLVSWSVKKQQTIARSST